MSITKKTGIALLTAILLTSCGTASSSPDDESSSPDLEMITVGMLQVSASAPIPYGVDQGIFEKHGLEVEIEYSQGGAAMLPAIETGTYDIGVLNPLTVLIANDQGLDMRMVSGISYAHPEGDDVSGIVVRKDSNISSFEDLAGAQTAVNLIQTQWDLTLMGAVENQGGDPASLNFLEIPFPDMAAQLEQGNIDAAYLPYPFLPAALENPDNELLGYPIQESMPGMPMLVSTTSAQFTEEHPDTVRKFVEALEEVMVETNANESAIRELLPEFMGLPPEAAENALLEDWSAEIREDHLETLGENAVRYGFIRQMPQNLYIDE